MSIRHAFAGLVLLCIALPGCGSLSKPYPDKSLHALHVGDPPAASLPASRANLRVDRVRIAEPFDAATFVYQVGDSRFRSDYYNGFVAPPGRLLTGEIAAFLARSGLFATVLTDESSADYQLTLETNVTAMYGDYQSEQKPQAVIAARFFVIDQSKGRFAVIFDKSYSQTTPIEQKTPDALVKAWEAGWTRLLTKLAADLRGAAVVMNAHADPQLHEPRAPQRIAR